MLITLLADTKFAITITIVTTIGTMVKDHFGATDLPRITGSPEYKAIDELVEAIAQIATTFKTKRYSGKCGVLPLIVREDKTRRVTNDTLDCSRAVKPTIRNPTITLSTLPNDEKTLHAEHKVAWSEYKLELAFNRYTVVTIVTNVGKQYIFAKCMDCIGYANKISHIMIAELRNHPIILNAEKREIRSFFVAP